MEYDDPAPTTARARELEILGSSPGDALKEPTAMDRPASRAQVVRQIDDAGTRAMTTERVIVKYSPEIGSLAGALAIAQGAFEDLERTRTARIASTKANYTFDYETLADVISATRKGLADNSLAVMQFPFPGRDTLTIRTWLVHGSGQWVYNDLTASIDGTDPRSVGSGITYLCRYARKAILGIAAAYDDDAEAASNDRAQREPVRRAERKSEQAPRQEPPRDPHVGTIKELEVKRDGEKVLGAIATLDTGYIAGTKDPEIVAALERLKRDGTAVDLSNTTPSSNPARFAPIIVEIAVARRGA